MPAFQKGDVVQLKSGGPEMTVVKVDEQGQVTCTWFEKSKRYTDTFEEALLTKADADLFLGTL